MSKTTRMGMAALAILLVAASSAHAAAPLVKGGVQFTLSGPDTVFAAPVPFAVTLTADLSAVTSECAGVRQPAGLASYTIGIAYDTTKVRAGNVYACGEAPPEFSDNPTATDPDRANELGLLRFSGYHETGTRSSGEVCLAVVYFFPRFPIYRKEILQLRPICEDVSGFFDTACPKQHPEMRARCASLSVTAIPHEIRPTGIDEGGSTAARQLQVQLSSAPSQPFQVHYETQDDSARTGLDYVTTSGTLSFAPGQTLQSLPITILGNSAPQPDRRLRLLISDSGLPSGAGVPVDVWIRDDDNPAGVRINQVTVAEGNDGVRRGVIRASRCGSANSHLTFEVQAVEGSATPGEDYLVEGASVEFLPGQQDAIIPLSIVGDRIGEGLEEFQVRLLQDNQEVARGAAGIFDDDPTPPRITRISPQSCSSAGGCASAIQGSGFLPGSVVTFGGVAAVVQYQYENALLITVPPGAGQVEVRVENPDMQAAHGSYTYQ